MNQIKRFAQSELLGKSLYAQRAVAHNSEIHWHEFYEITYYPDAIGKTVINNTEYPISPGSLILLTPLDFHSVDIESSQSKVCYKIYFLDNQFEVGLAKYLNGPLVLNDLKNDEFICSLLKELCVVASQTKDHEYMTEKLQGYLLKSLIIKILKSCHVENASQPKQMSNDLIKQAITYITSHFSEDPTLNEVADILGVSPNYFSKRFKIVTGTTFQTYITNLKINYAKQLLAESDYPVYEISTKSGFTNLSNFLRTFKRMSNMTPTEYRTNCLISK